MTGLTTRTGGAVGVACAVLWAFSVVPACAATPLPLTVSTQTSVISEVILPPSGGAQDTFNDTATLSGAPAGMPAPTGTVTFDVYGPYAVFGGPLASTPTCTGTPLSTSTDPIGPEGSATSSTFTSQGAGEYALTASYSGDAVYGAVTSACNAPNESVTVPIVGYAAPGSPSTQPGSAPSSPTPATPITPTSSPGSTPTAPTPSTSGVRLSGLTLRPSVFAASPGVGPHHTARHGTGDTHEGTVIGFTLSHPGTVSIAISRLVSGVRRPNARCIALAGARVSTTTGGLRPVHGVVRCRAAVPVGTFHRPGNAGANQVPFAGQLNGKPLALGSYVAQVTASAGASPSSTASATFRVVA